MRLARIAYGGSITNVIAGDMELYQRGIRRLTLIDGLPDEVVPALVAQQGVVVNEAFVHRYHVARGQELVLQTASGEARLPILGVHFDNSFADMGVIHLDYRLYRRLWHDETVNFIEPALRSGADRGEVMKEIRRRWGTVYPVFVFTTEEFHREADAYLAQAIGLTYPLVALALAIALLGVVNSLLTSVLERIRQIGVARAIGATRFQVGCSVMLESLFIGVVGAGLAVVVGPALGYLQVHILFRTIFGMTMFVRYPVQAVAFAAVAAIVFTAAAGFVPGRRAARLGILEALRHE